MSHSRKRARQAVVQALYQWQVSHAKIADIEQQFCDEHAGSRTDMEYFSGVLKGVISSVSELDELFISYIEWPIDELNPVELAILRLACYELKHRADIPVGVIINEAVDLTKRYGADQAYKFVNGVVDRVAKDIRSAERSSRMAKKN